MRFALVFALAVAVTGGVTPPARLHAQPRALIAPTDARTPADERKTFTVPAGFEVQLVAAEPDIQKPIQLAFDAKGRLWVTTSHHYPFPAEKGKGTDRLYVLSDFGPDGKARTVQIFAENLNIPIGILPLPDCKSCIVSSAGEIRKLTDTDGDGKADKTDVLFTGFGYEDTHGMVNSFTLMPDGWVYACHGFKNTSKVKGGDGHAVEMQSGNTFRFRPDGSRIEVFTRGQVNPFGIAVDPWFNLYTADCHSKPVTQLIPGAVYQSFGKPHDGLGFAPHVTRHDHGSTGLCGLTWYDAEHFPKEYRGCMFLGNVVTNRINSDRIEWTGSTPVAKELPDFLVSTDPWFRPADIKLGPDGALYVADFYNKIIGHYEVDLKHPQRDKDRGRVWRIVWKGKGEPGSPATAVPKMPGDLTQLGGVDQVMLAKENPNLTTRMLALEQFIHRVRVERGGERVQAIEIYLKLTKDSRGFDPPPEDGSQFRNLILWERILTAAHNWNEQDRKWAVKGMDDSQKLLARVCVEAVAAHPNPDNIKPLIELIQKIPAADTHLRHAARIALRNQLTNPARAWDSLMNLPPGAAAVVADVAPGVPNYTAAEFLTAYIKSGAATETQLPAFATHIGRYGTKDEYEIIIDYTAMQGRGVKPIAVLHALVRGIQARGWRAGVKTSDLLVARVRAELDNGTPASRLAVLKLLGDLPAVVMESYNFRENPDADPVPIITKLLRDAQQTEEFRGAAVETLVRLDPKSGYASAEKLIDDPQTPPGLREKVALVLAASVDRNHRQAAKDAINSVPYRSGVAIAVALAATTGGAELLLDAVKQGKAPARLLQEPFVLARLRAANVENLEKRIAELTKGLQPADQKLAALLKQRTTRFVKAKPDKELGAKLFTRHCAACHQIGGQGGKVGPQLDGIGVRGLERLLEDTLDPNRNVDAAFRARVLTLTDGTTKTGLMLRVEGEVVVLADGEGKEFRVPTKEIESNRETALSPMPANFGETIPEPEFFHLLAYLLDQRAKDAPRK